MRGGAPAASSIQAMDRASAGASGAPASGSRRNSRQNVSMVPRWGLSAS